MPRLVPPTVDVHRSFLAGMAEFQAEGRGTPTDNSMVGGEILTFSPTWSSPEGFAAYVAHMRAQALPDTPRPAGYVPSTTLWWVEGDEYLGRIAIRHRLNESLLREGGHIGYDVRPTARRRGHATAMLAAAVPVARDLGIERVLICCDEDNVGSRLVIEHNGGVYEDSRVGKRRYWVPTVDGA